MYRPTDAQVDLFVAGSQLAPAAQKMLRRSWAYGFRAHIYPLILRLEPELARLYESPTGRPNWSVARMLGLCILQAWFDLTDRALEQALAFDIRFQYALDLRSEDAYLSRRSMSDFRLRLVTTDPEGETYRQFHDAVAKAAIDDLGLDISNQRLDSTRVMSNIRTRGRADLFSRTLQRFLDELGNKHPEAFEALPSGIKTWYGERERSWFGKGGPRAALDTLAQWAVDLGFAFSSDERVLGWESYFLVARLVAEYCVLEPNDEAPPSDLDEPVAVDVRLVVGQEPNKDDGHSAALDSNDTGAPPAKPEADDQPGVASVRRGGRRGGRSLQSPHDPDASYGHKGVGYSAHVTETCNNDDKPEIITDYEVRDGADNDWGKSSAVLERLAERELSPKEAFADAGYPTPQAILDAYKMGVVLQAPVNRNGGATIGLDQFQFDDEGQVVSCPAGHAPTHHRVRREPGCDGPELHAYFDGKICTACPLYGQCPARARKGSKGRHHVRIEPRLIARDHAIVRQQDPRWWLAYSIRSGVEATMSELKRGHGFGRLRVRTRPRVLFGVAFRIIACNVKRWLGGLTDSSPRSPMLASA
jgi:hypothetical protein